jgi:membrane-associated phospholipid phosphatase
VKRGDEVFFLNQFYSTKLNVLFIWLTKLGEELIAIIIGILLIFTVPFKDVLGFAVSALIVSLSVFVFKNYVFEDIDRPREVLGHGLKLVEGLYINSHNSFPSGHTAAAFTYFTYLAFLVKSPYGKTGLLVLALLTGLSRIYLAQHFLIDVIAGSVLGVCLAIFGYLIFHSSNLLRKCLNETSPL